MSTEDIETRIIIPNSCKHIKFIQKNFIEGILQLTHPDVLDYEKNKCYVPGCNNTDKEQLKTFIYMGSPPKRTYYSINYIGIALHGSDVAEWYTAYIPINISSFNNDTYVLKRVLLKIIAESKLWLFNNEIHNDIITQCDEEAGNFFKMPVDNRHGIDRKRYIFATPSCMYATKYELASPLEFEELDVNVQILLQVRVKTNSFIESSNTLDIAQNFDSCFPNRGIEWYIDDPNSVSIQSLLFKILPKKLVSQETPSSAEKKVIDDITKINLIMPLRSNDRNLLSDPGFVELRNLYKSNGMLNDEVYIDEDVIKIRMKWNDKLNKVLFYLKSLIGNKSMEWDDVMKIWKVPRLFVYEIVKFSLHLSLKINERLIFDSWSLLNDMHINGVPDIYNKNIFINWLNNYNIWTFQRIILHLSENSPSATPSVATTPRNSNPNDMPIRITILPFNKDVIAKFKERNSIQHTYLWNQDIKCWQCSNLNDLIVDLISVLPHLREMTSNDFVSLKSKGVDLKVLFNQKNQKRKQSQDDVNNFKKQKSEEDFDVMNVTNIIITVAGKDIHKMRIVDKIKRVVSTVKPPESSISSTGKIVMGGAGTGGIELVEIPRDFEVWNQISFCVVPNEDEEGKIPIDDYDANILASLIGEVFIIKEEAIDYLLNHFKKWPSPHDTINYNKWNDIITENEPLCWGGINFDGRQSLAQGRLFSEEDFYVCGNSTNHEVVLCRLLIQLGNGNIVSDPKEAEYVIITDSKSADALALYNKFGDNDEDQIANTHGARHSTLVTPKYIYDCILEWKLKRPTHDQKHLAFK